MTSLIVKAFVRLARGFSKRGRRRSPGRLPEQLRAAGWMPIAASTQVGRTPVVHQLTRDGQRRTVLLWRTRSNRPVVMDAQCPHRPYSMAGARLVGDALECPIHRRLFGANGRCIGRPDAKPAQLLLSREEAGYVWLVKPPSE